MFIVRVCPYRDGTMTSSLLPSPCPEWCLPSTCLLNCMNSALHFYDGQRTVRHKTIASIGAKMKGFREEAIWSQVLKETTTEMTGFKQIYQFPSRVRAVRNMGQQGQHWRSGAGEDGVLGVGRNLLRVILLESQGWPGLGELLQSPVTWCHNARCPHLGHPLKGCSRVVYIKGYSLEFTSMSAGFLRQLGHPPDEDRGTAQSSSASWASVALILYGRLIRSWQPHEPRRISNVFFWLWLVPLLVMPLVLSTAVSYPKLTDVKHPAGSGHRFRGSGILEVPSGDSSSLLHHIRSFSWDDFPGAGGFYFQCAFFTCISDTPARDGWRLGSGGTVTEDLQMVSITGV